MIPVREAIIVEGKYDKIKLSSLVDGLIIETNGFRIFRDREKRALLRALAGERGLLVLTDSDSAGFVIRNHLKGLVPPEQIRHAYIPEILGKEKRKTAPSKEGLLGVEGMTRETLEKILSRHITRREDAGEKITKADLYEAGLSGKENSAGMRAAFLKELGLPTCVSATAFLDILNFMMTREAFLERLPQK